MSIRIILCSECGIKNNIDINQKTANCQNCQKKLIFKKTKSKLIILIQNFISNWWGLFIVMGLVWLFATSDSTVKKTASNYTNNTGIVKFDKPIENINHGILYGENYFVKVVDSLTEKLILSAYINGGRPFQVDLPLGSYEIKYASGQQWYGTYYKFGPETSYSKTRGVFRFQSDNYGYSGYTIELIKQRNGNLKTQFISKDEF